MNENKNVVIKYDYSLEQCLKESSAPLKPITNSVLYFDGAVNLKLLGEKKDFFISGVTNTDLTFSNKKFSTVTFLMTPLPMWYTLELSIQQIYKLRVEFEDINQLAINKTSFDINTLTPKNFENEMAVLINKYELEHYKVFIMIKKYPIPIEIVPHENDYFQVIIRIDRKKV